MKKMGRWAAGLILLAGCTGAASTRRLRPELDAPAEQWVGVKRVAVFPPDNWTTDIGVEYVTWYRAVIHELLREKGYVVTPLVKVNRFMLENHFTLAGEVRIYSPEELAEELDADGLFFWDVTEFGAQVNVDFVKADGTRLWSTGEVRLGLAYNAHPRQRVHRTDFRFSLVLSEILRRFPPPRG